MSKIDLEEKGRPHPIPVVEETRVPERRFAGGDADGVSLLIGVVLLRNVERAACAAEGVAAAAVVVDATGVGADVAGEPSDSLPPEPLSRDAA